MFVGKVIGTVICTVKHEAYDQKRILIVQPLDCEGRPGATKLAPYGYTVAVDYVGAGLGDLVLWGGAPGVARDVFQMDKAPIRDLIMGIVDRVDIDGKRVITLYEEPKPLTEEAGPEGRKPKDSGGVKKGNAL